MTGRVLSPGEVFSLLHCAEATMNPPLPNLTLLRRHPLAIRVFDPDYGPTIAAVFVDMAALPGKPRLIRLSPDCEHVRVTSSDRYGFEIECTHDYIGEYLIFGEAF